MFIGVIDGYCGCCLSGLKSVLLINIDLNCLFRASAFMLGSLTNITFSFNNSVDKLNIMSINENDPSDISHTKLQEAGSNSNHYTSTSNPGASYPFIFFYRV